MIFGFHERELAGRPGSRSGDRLLDCLRASLTTGMPGKGEGVPRLKRWRTNTSRGAHKRITATHEKVPAGRMSARQGLLLSDCKNGADPCPHPLDRFAVRLAML